MDITGRKLFVRALLEEGVDTIFGYPGGMVTDVMDELYKQEEIRLILPRHEQALIHEGRICEINRKSRRLPGHKRTRSDQYDYGAGRRAL